MSKVIKNIEMLDNRKQTITTDGILTSDEKYVVAAVARSYVGPWKASGTGSGNDTRSIGFGDVSIFRADNVKELSTNDAGVTEVSADLTPCIGPFGFRANEIKTPQGVISSSVNSFLSDSFGMGSNSKKFSDVVAPSIQEAVDEAIDLAVDCLITKGPAKASLSGKLARAASRFAAMADIADKKAAQKASQAQQQESTGLIPQGDQKKIGDILPQ